ncbi:MAG: phage DNA packaging protein J [Myxococcales bacterium]|nr:phage DNA packaging protein J [Myxococcales bacterium]MCB9531021.1 phage DNA packaging protein J [Myxococcales bacterium]
MATSRTRMCASGLRHTRPQSTRATTGRRRWARLYRVCSPRCSATAVTP